MKATPQYFALICMASIVGFSQLALGGAPNLDGNTYYRKEGGIFITIHQNGDQIRTVLVPQGAIDQTLTGQWNEDKGYFDCKLIRTHKANGGTTVMYWTLTPMNKNSVLHEHCYGTDGKDDLPLNFGEDFDYRYVPPTPTFRPAQSQPVKPAPQPAKPVFNQGGFGYIIWRQVGSGKLFALWSSGLFTYKTREEAEAAAKRTVENVQAGTNNPPGSQFWYEIKP
jgi:hypothetical protein